MKINLHDEEIEIPEISKNYFEKGKKVFHVSYGYGKIKSIGNGERYPIKVAFYSQTHIKSFNLRGEEILGALASGIPTLKLA